MLAGSVHGEGSLPGSQTTTWSPSIITLGVRASVYGFGGVDTMFVSMTLPTVYLKKL